MFENTRNFVYKNNIRAYEKSKELSQQPEENIFPEKYAFFFIYRKQFNMKLKSDF
jgi:hypothetical protein